MQQDARFETEQPVEATEAASRDTMSS